MLKLLLIPCIMVIAIWAGDLYEAIRWIGAWSSLGVPLWRIILGWTIIILPISVGFIGITLITLRLRKKGDYIFWKFPW